VRLVTYMLGAGLLGLALFACGAEGTGADVGTVEGEIVGERHLGFGTPTDAFDADDHVIIHPEFALSYNRFRNGANWASWLVTKDDYGDAPRYDKDFFPDPKLPADFYAVVDDDYEGTGYNRGHLVRSSERTRTVEANMATFRTTNILPQTGQFNSGEWFQFETFCQRVVQEEGRDLYIVSGPIYPQACATDLEPEGNHPSKECKTIGRSELAAERIAVPTEFFKIVVHLPRGRRLSAVDADTRVTAIVLPNTDVSSETTSWQQGLTTVDAIEAITGYDFLSKVSPAIQAVIEARKDVIAAPP